MLGALKEEKVFRFFEEISQIPRGSYHNERIRDYLVQFAVDRELSYDTDSANNVIIRKPGSKGYENAEPVILQAHMDMVCESDTDHKKAHDFLTEPLELYVDGDFIKAKNTTLGADNGVGMAYILTILNASSILPNAEFGIDKVLIGERDFNCPPIEALFTADEEVGMVGAAALDLTKLKGKYLINLDTGEEGHLLTSCAGGTSLNVSFKTGEKKRIKQISEIEQAIRVSVKGLTGGHSGMDIDKKRTNAGVLLGRILMPLIGHCRLAEIKGGISSNAITRESEAIILFDGEEDSRKCFCDNMDCILDELRTSEPEISIVYETYDGELSVAGKDFTDRFLSFLSVVPQGIQVMSPDMEGLVESSVNMGCMQMKEEQIELKFCLRSQKSGYKEYLYHKLVLLAEQFGGLCEREGDYPAWDYKKDSVLRDIAVKTYREMYGKEMTPEGVHAGLECGIFSEGIQGVDIISIGPDITDAHSPKEKVSISSLRRVLDFLIQILEEMNLQNDNT